MKKINCQNSCSKEIINVVNLVELNDIKLNMINKRYGLTNNINVMNINGSGLYINNVLSKNSLMNKIFVRGQQ